MILRVLQVFVFIVAATLEVKVHASQVVTLKNEVHPLEEPAHCLDSGERCAVKTSSGRKFQFDVGATKVTLGSGSALIRVGASRVNLVSGSLLVQSEDDFFVEAEYGKVILKNAYVLIENKSRKLFLSVISGEAFIQPRGRDEMYPVAPGQSNWLGEVDKSGVAQSGLPIPVQFQDHAYLWSGMYSGKKKDFEKELKEFAGVWQKANAEAAIEHKQLVQRRIAALEDDYQKQQERVKKKQVFEAQMRALFRKKTLDQ